VPGFREGKVPLDIVKKKYGQSSLKDISERIISDNVGKAIQENKLPLILPPVLISADIPEEGKDFKFEVQVDLKPKAPKLKLSGVKIKKDPQKPIADEEIQRELDYLLEKDASFTDIKEVREARVNDCVVVKYSGFLDGKPHPKMQSEGDTVVLGTGQFLPEFETGLMGMKKDETKNVDVKFPENYFDKGVAGKIAEFKLTLLSIKEKVLPELDDNFAKDADDSVKTLDELKEKIKKRLEVHREEDEKKQLLEKLGDELVKKHSMKISKRQVTQVAYQLAERTHKMMHKMGVKHDDNEKHQKELLEKSMGKAERDIQLAYILEAVASENKIEVSDGDVEKRLEANSKQAGLSITEIKAHYAAKEEGEQVSRLERLKMDIQEEKSLDYALTQATIK